MDNQRARVPVTPSQIKTFQALIKGVVGNLFDINNLTSPLSSNNPPLTCPGAPKKNRIEESSSDRRKCWKELKFPESAVDHECSAEENLPKNDEFPGAENLLKSDINNYEIDVIGKTSDVDA